MEGFAEVLGGEVGWEVGGKAGAEAGEGCEGVSEGLDVAAVGDEGGAAVCWQERCGGSGFLRMSWRKVESPLLY